MENHHYAALFASFMHCEHTCKRGLAHKNADHHDVHTSLETYPSKQKVQAALDALLEDFLHHERDIPPHLRAAFCNAHQTAQVFLK